MTYSFVLSCQPESMDLTLNELKNGTLIGGSDNSGIPGKLESVLAPGVLLYNVEGDRDPALTSLHRLDPIFVRHLHPVDLILKVDSAESLIEVLADLPAGSSIAVQITAIEDAPPTPELAAQFEQAVSDLGFTVDPQATDRILSLTCTSEQTYAGLSSGAENRSPWPGGRSRYRRSEDRLSRAGFKVEEAFATFMTLNIHPQEARALDLGAAPGSWTQVLLAYGYQVLAIDPAALDARLLESPAVTHYKGKSEDWIAEQEDKRGSDRSLGFDLIVNDMKMDVALSATVTADCAEYLKPGGQMIMTFKLPAKKQSAKIKAGLEILSRSYTDLRARQLYHNRSEITVAGKLKDGSD